VSSTETARAQRGSSFTENSWECDRLYAKKGGVCAHL
jgi:hypothetical protein